MSLLSSCNVYCGTCALFQNDKCLGCIEESRRAEAEVRVLSDVRSCAEIKKLAIACATCRCDRYAEGIFLRAY